MQTTIDRFKHVFQHDDDELCDAPCQSRRTPAGGTAANFAHFAPHPGRRGCRFKLRDRPAPAPTPDGQLFGTHLRALSSAMYYESTLINSTSVLPAVATPPWTTPPLAPAQQLPAVFRRQTTGIHPALSCGLQGASICIPFAQH